MTWYMILAFAGVLSLSGAPVLAQPTKPAPWQAQPAPAPGYSPAPQAVPQSVPPARGRCAQSLANGCMRIQTTCQLGCPPLWRMNPSASAFTPTDRPQCLNRCLNQYRMCLTRVDCL
jgi:hypothetical protein